MLFVISDILLYDQQSVNNTKQRKLFHWDQRKQFVVYFIHNQNNLYRVSTVYKQRQALHYKQRTLSIFLHNYINLVFSSISLQHPLRLCLLSHVIMSK